MITVFCRHSIALDIMDDRLFIRKGGLFSYACGAETITELPYTRITHMAKEPGGQSESCLAIYEEGHQTPHRIFFVSDIYIDEIQAEIAANMKNKGDC